MHNRNADLIIGVLFLFIVLNLTVNMMVIIVLTILQFKSST